MAARTPSGTKTNSTEPPDGSDGGEDELRRRLGVLVLGEQTARAAFDDLG